MRIANLAYGSIVNQPHSQNYGGKLQVKHEFRKVTNVSIPLIFGRLSSAKNSSKSRVTLVTDKKGVECPLYYAESEHTNLIKAINEMKSREGTSLDSNISYLRTGKPRNLFGRWSIKTIMVSGVEFSGRWKNISEDKIKEIAGWILDEGFDAAVITEFDSNRTPDEIMGLVTESEGIRSRTKAYFENLPTEAKASLNEHISSLGVDTSRN